MNNKINKLLGQQALPSFLKSRAGWGKLLEMKRSKYPHLHQIEPTNVCPYNCIMCPRGEKMRRKKGYMDFNTYSKVINEVATYPDEIKRKEIELFHFGESLLHPQICEMNELASSKGLNTVLSVNAIELTKTIAENLIKGEAGKIIVSIDGFDTESFFKIRGRKINYQKAIENVLNASSLIKSLNGKTKLVVRMIALKQNSHKIDDFKNFWKGNDIESEIRPFFPWGEKNMVELGEYEKYPPFMPCPFSWQYLVVQWNGDVVACCRDYNAENKMGNVNEGTLEEIWNSGKYTSFRESMINGKYKNSICQLCMNLYYTET
ncbi:MAG: radical SAM/SPASM domain-containing protein [Bacteroidia bacterium]|nr:radical SAM/SPASM domain-containing protein [Bacteroidia bacterium]